MSLWMECRKIRRTGFLPAWIAGGILAAAVPVLNTAVRADLYTKTADSPVLVLFRANWQMMAMLNVLLGVLGACMLFHTEYAENAMQRMRTLPIREGRMFFGKFALLAAMCTAVLGIEAAGTAFCTFHWFSFSEGVGMELFRGFGYALLLMLPAVLASLLAASACKNMWVSLGIGVVCVFTATMLPTDHFVLSMFPFALPFQILAGTADGMVRGFAAAAAAECVVLSAAEVFYIRVRRLFS